jgi:diaminobutyrate-2-oxoglutarate transaminase
MDATPAALPATDGLSATVARGPIAPPVGPQDHALPGPNSQGYLDRQSARESNARSYPRKIPIAITEAKGLFIKDADGQVYYDCLSGAGTLALGHNHPVVLEAIQQILASGLPLHTLDLTTPVKDAFVEELFAALPPAFARRAKIQFCGPSGSDAVEAAVKLVKTATGRRSFLSFRGGYHGMTQGALALMGNLGPKLAVPNMMPEVQFLPYPYAYRCPLGLGGEAGERATAQYVRSLLEDPEGGVVPPAGMILEAVQGEGGVIPAPDAWLRAIRETTRAHGVPMILDEVQSGVGRTGKLFAFEHAGIEPDVVVISKAIGGSLPLAVVVYDEALDTWGPGAHAGTFRGNQMAMATGLATLKYVQANRLADHAAAMGDRLMANLRRIQSGTQAIGEVRGRGLMVGVEIVQADAAPDALGARPAHPALARRLQAECLKRGLILELGGRHGCVVRFLPPLIIEAEQVDAICVIFHEALEAAERAVAPVAVAAP